MDKSSETVGTRLRLERERLGLSKHELGRVGYCSADTQAKIEAGEFWPDPFYLVEVSEVGINIDWVLAGSVPMKLIWVKDRPPQRPRRRILRRWQGFSRNQLAELKRRAARNALTGIGQKSSNKAAS